HASSLSLHDALPIYIGGITGIGIGGISGTLTSTTNGFGFCATGTDTGAGCLTLTTNGSGTCTTGTSTFGGCTFSGGGINGQSPPGRGGSGISILDRK